MKLDSHTTILRGDCRSLLKSLKSDSAILFVLIRPFAAQQQIDDLQKRISQKISRF